MIFTPLISLCVCLLCERTGRAKPTGIVFPPVLQDRSLSSAGLDTAKKNGKCGYATGLMVREAAKVLTQITLRAKLFFIEMKKNFSS